MSTSAYLFRNATPNPPKRPYLDIVLYLRYRDFSDLILPHKCVYGIWESVHYFSKCESLTLFCPSADSICNLQYVRLV